MDLNLVTNFGAGADGGHLGPGARFLRAAKSRMSWAVQPGGGSPSGGRCIERRSGLGEQET